MALIDNYLVPKVNYENIKDIPVIEDYWNPNYYVLKILFNFGHK